MSDLTRDVCRSSRLRNLITASRKVKSRNPAQSKPLFIVINRSQLGQTPSNDPTLGTLRP